MDKIIENTRRLIPFRATNWDCAIYTNAQYRDTESVINAIILELKGYIIGVLFLLVLFVIQHASTQSVDLKWPYRNTIGNYTSNKPEMEYLTSFQAFPFTTKCVSIITLHINKWGRKASKFILFNSKANHFPFVQFESINCRFIEYSCIYCQLGFKYAVEWIAFVVYELVSVSL